MGRGPKYDWSDKRDVCHKLYVEQKLPAPKIVEYFANHFKLPESELPAARDFQRQFKKWGFPDRIRKLNADEELTLKDRMRELFKENISAQEIQDKLNDEGWGLDDYRFNTIRKRLGMVYRTNGDGYGSWAKENKRKRASGDVEVNEGDNAALENQLNGSATTRPELPPLPPEEAARRAEYLARIEFESEQKLQTRKRRRRIRGLGHLPPDAPGMEPRYGSETSLDECKAFLHLNNDLYIQIRNQYEGICREMGIIKMSLCQEGQWQASKDRLVRENMHLSSVLHPLQSDIDKRNNALNCICSDVTKRMRGAQRSMTIADASNVLGLDPLQSKDIRRGLYEILEAAQFTSVLACGNEKYEELKQQWYANSELLSRVMAEGDQVKVRAVNVLCKDARKRYCDDLIKKHPDARVVIPQKGYGPGPGPAHRIPGQHKKNKSNVSTTSPATAAATSTSFTNRPTLIPLGPAWEGREIPQQRMSTLFDLAGQDINFDLDPLLTKTTHGPPWPPPMSGTMDTSPATQSRPQAASIAAYFRLAPNSTLIGHHPRMWLGKLAGASMGELRKAATAKAGAARVAKIHGVAKNEDGSENSWLIESDDELEVYLSEAGEKATFVVLLEGGYA